MYDLLTEKWGVGRHLALALLAHFGGHGRSPRWRVVSAREEEADCILLLDCQCGRFTRLFACCAKARIGPVALVWIRARAQVSKSALRGDHSVRVGVGGGGNCEKRASSVAG
jgi:hypothetical protein